MPERRCAKDSQTGGRPRRQSAQAQENKETRESVPVPHIKVRKGASFEVHKIMSAGFPLPT